MDARVALSRSVIAPLVMAKNGSRELSYLRRYRRTQFFSPEQLAALQLRRLRETLASALANSPYYAWSLRVAGLARVEDAGSLDDLARLPRLSKQTLRESWEEIVTPDPGGAPRQEKRTSGSTGVPLRILVDEAARQHKAALTAGTTGGPATGWEIRSATCGGTWALPRPRRNGSALAWLDRMEVLDSQKMDEARMAAFTARIRAACACADRARAAALLLRGLPESRG